MLKPGRRPSGWRLLLAVAVFVLASLEAAAAATAAAPHFIIVSGPPYQTPILLRDHRENLVLYTALIDAPSPSASVVARLVKRPRLDLAVYWNWSSREAPTHPGDASQHGSFYPAHRNQPAVIELMVDGDDRPRLLPENVLRILARHGVAGTTPRFTCPLSTRTSVVPPNAGFSPAGFNYGNRLLRAGLYWPDGILTAGPLSDGAVYATIDPNGSVSAKVGWWRKTGALQISGRRLDRPAPPLRSDVPGGYGDSGFQATGITFPTTGCWRVSGRSGQGTLTFVVWVAKSVR